MHYFTETSAEMFNSLWIWCETEGVSLLWQGSASGRNLWEFLLLLGEGGGINNWVGGGSDWVIRRHMARPLTTLETEANRSRATGGLFIYFKHLFEFQSLKVRTQMHL